MKINFLVTKRKQCKRKAYESKTDHVVVDVYKHSIIMEAIRKKYPGWSVEGYCELPKEVKIVEDELLFGSQFE